MCIRDSCKGYYRLDVVSSSYDIFALKEGYTPAQKCIEYIAPGERKEVNFTLRKINSIGIIYGKVKEAPTPHEKPVYKAIVRAVMVGTKGSVKYKLYPIETYATLTDEEGKYKLILPSGSYRIDVLKRGYEPASVGYVLLRPGDKRKVDFTIWRRCTLYGYVTDGIKSIEGAKVEMYRPLPIPIGAHSRHPKPVYFAYTNGEGYYEIGNIRPGYYKVVVSKRGYVTANQSVYLYSGDILRKDFVLMMEPEKQDEIHIPPIS